MQTTINRYTLDILWASAITGWALSFFLIGFIIGGMTK
jgi:hypothetical protein